MTGIEIENLNYDYIDKKGGKTAAVKNLSVSFSARSFNVLVGYSGCGKTTLLKIIAGLIDDYDGDVCINGENADNLTIKQRDVALVAQDFTLYPHLTVFDNIAFPLKLEKFKKEEIVERVIKLSDALDIKCCLTRKPKHISLGQQQRVAIARALVKNPRICLLDEPFSNIDPTLRASARVMLKNLFKEMDATVVYVTHDFQEAVALADRLFVMNDGSIEISGAPMEVYNSGNAIVESLKSGEV